MAHKNLDKIEKKLDKIENDELILDIGPDTVNEIKNIIKISKTVLWNGPAGYFENPNFANGSYEIAKAIIKKNKERSIYSVVGGGDTVALINQMNAIKKITDEIISRGHGEEGTLLFTAAFSDTHLFLRESYVDHKAFHVHLDTVKDILDDFFSLLELESLVIVASEDDIQKMKVEMKTLGMQATYCVINNGFSI